MGFERAEEEEWDAKCGGKGTSRGGEGEIGTERRRQESRELASPSANFITELVVFAQIISIYSTQAGNLFASECMREWNLPPRSRLARARSRSRSRICALMCAQYAPCCCRMSPRLHGRMNQGGSGWMMEMGARGCPRAHTSRARPCKRTARSSPLTFSAGKRKVTRERVKSARIRASVSPIGPLVFVSASRDEKSRSDALNGQISYATLLSLIPPGYRDCKHRGIF